MAQLAVTNGQCAVRSAASDSEIENRNNCKLNGGRGMGRGWMKVCVWGGGGERKTDTGKRFISSFLEDTGLIVFRGL